MTDATVGVPVTPGLRRPPLWWILVRHEWRLTMRSIGGGRRGPDAKTRKVRGIKRRVVVYGLATVLLHLAGWALSRVLPHEWVDSSLTRGAAITIVAFLFTLMLSTAMTRVVSAFHERRDLDLLLTAPISPTLILVVRALTIVATVSTFFAIFIYPLADSGVATRHWWMARLYPFVPLLAMFATGIALALTGLVVRLIGVRRARVGLQVFSALVGASMYLVSQSRQFLPHAWSDAVVAWVASIARMDDAPWPVLLVKGLFAGDGWAWVVFVVASVGVFSLAVWGSRARFHEIAQTPEADSRVSAPERAVVDRRIASAFGHGLFRTLLIKEWRLILRAPQLISQILLQLLYLMPLMFIAIKGHGSSGIQWGPAAFVAGFVGLTGTLATSLAWLTVSAEDAPDLIAGSPKGSALILASKLVAAIVPPVVLLVLAALGTSQRSLHDALLLLLFGCLSCASAAILAAASPMRANRSDFQRRHQGRGFSALIEGLQFLLWAAAAGAAVSGVWYVSVPVTIVAMVLPSFHLPRALRNIGSDEH